MTRRTEIVDVFHGQAERSIAPLSPIIQALPASVRPVPLPGCASCPSGTWSVTSQKVTCWCAARGYQSWVPMIDPIMLCEDREIALDKVEDEIRQQTARGTPWP